MREIKFRGKRIDTGEWVYGGIIQWNGRAAIIQHDLWLNGIWKIKKFEVDPETVGQYIGHKDKNGKEIYEGDIYKNPIFIGILEVTYNAGRYKGKHIVHVEDSTGKDVFGGLNPWAPDNTCEILGNIHENPELLEKQ